MIALEKLCEAMDHEIEAQADAMADLKTAIRTAGHKRTTSSGNCPASPS